MENISVAIPYYNNSQFMKETLSPMINDDRISEIIIVDDKSNDLDKLIKIILELKCNKIKLYKNDKNLGVYLNKLKSVSLCSNKWTILFDSDNILDKTYIDTLYSAYPWNDKYIYAPAWANALPDYAPNLDYRKFDNTLFDAKKVIDTRSDTRFGCLMNTCNYFINVKNYTNCMNKYKDNYNYYIISSLDSKTLFTDWICNGNYVYVLKDLVYRHRVHPTSNYTLADKSYENRVHYILDKKVYDYFNSLNN